MRDFFLFLSILFVVATVAVIAVWTLQPREPVAVEPEGNGQVACDLDAKLCPDGSTVGRQGPNCEFASCPAFLVE